jgi:molybdenum cofactor cytidylyltransferase
MRPESENPTPIAAVVLAAGGSTRMGTSKQLLPVAGKPLVRLVVDAVCEAGLDQVVVVVGAGAGSVSDALAGITVDIVVNQEWRRGLSSSLQVGVNALRGEIQAALIVLADQAVLSPRLIRALADGYLARRAPVVAPVYQGRRANPVLFDRSLFPELAAVEGDEGGRSVVARHEDQLYLLPVDDEAVVVDVDTPADYERIVSALTP